MRPAATPVTTPIRELVSTPGEPRSGRRVPLHATFIAPSILYARNNNLCIYYEESRRSFFSQTLPFLWDDRKKKEGTVRDQICVWTVIQIDRLTAKGRGERRIGACDLSIVQLVSKLFNQRVNQEENNICFSLWAAIHVVIIPCVFYIMNLLLSTSEITHYGR